MKLRNLMYATMVACAFASCSKDEVIDPVNPNPEEANTTLEVRVANAQTKADATATDATITSLTLVVFNNGVVEVVGSAKEGVLTASRVALKPGNKKVLLLANVTNNVIQKGAAYNDVMALTKTFDGEIDGALSMNSKVYDVTIDENKVNYLGYGEKGSDDKGNYLTAAGSAEVLLYRNVAKVVLKTITLDNSKFGTQYPNASLKLKNVFILHGHNVTKIATVEPWGATEQAGVYLNGTANNEAYAGWVTTMNGLTELFNYINDAAVKYTSYSAYNQVFGDAILGYNDEKEVVLIDKSAKSFYTYENTELAAVVEEKKGYNTLLVVQGDFSYDKVGGGRAVANDRYYTLSVGQNIDYTGVTFIKENDITRQPTNGILRNMQYNISLTLAGIGTQTPFGPKPDGGGTDPEDPGKGDTFLEAQVKVVPFGEVDQPGTIE